MRYTFYLYVKIDTIAEKQRAIIIDYRVKSHFQAFIYSVKYLYKNRMHNVKYIGHCIQERAI